MRPGRARDQLSPDVYAPLVHPLLRAIYSFQNSNHLRNQVAKRLSNYRRQLRKQSRQLWRLPRSYDSLLSTLLRSYATLRRRRSLTGIPGSRGRSTSMTSLLPSTKPSLQPSTTLLNMSAWKRLLRCLGPLRGPTPPRPTRSGVRSTSWNRSRRLLSSHTRYRRSGLSFDAGYSTSTPLWCCWQTRWVLVRPSRSLRLPFTPK